MITQPGKQLTLFDSTCIIVGIVIGAGIYEAAPVVARSAPDTVWLITFWVAGGVIALIGALCYAELATAYPYEGGDYVYLTRAFGRRTGFLYTWASFWLVTPANIGAIAYIYGRYAQQLWPLPGAAGHLVHAVTAILFLTFLNLCGVTTGKWTQNIVTAAKVLGLLAIIALGLLVTAPPASVTTVPDIATGFAPGLAMIMVLFAYGGWSNISFVAAEVRNPHTNILRALVLGTTLITAIYLLVNMAFLHTLGYQGVAGATSVAAELMHVYTGPAGALLISGLICVTCLGNLNGMILTNARVYYALGLDHDAWRWLGVWHKDLDAPVNALVAQAAVALVLIISLAGAADIFQQLVIFSAPVYWFFFTLTALSLIKMRRQIGAEARHYRVPFYPLTPLLFILATGFMCSASLSYAWENRQALIYLIVVVLGLGLLASIRQAR